MFKLPFGKKSRSAASTAGTGLKSNYTYRFDDFGHKVYYKTGETDFYAEIQAALPATNIYTLLARYNSGDKEALNLRPSVYADVSDAPTTMVEALNLVNAATLEFNKLPLEIKREYDFSASRFISDYGSSHMVDLIRAYNSKIPVVKDIPQTNLDGGIDNGTVRTVDK